MRAATGAETEVLSEESAELDEALAAVYEPEIEDERSAPEAVRRANLGASRARLLRWLGDVRKHFDHDVVALIQRDAIERRGLRQLLMEPETLAAAVPSVELVATIVSLKEHIPEETRETARAVVGEVVRELMRRLRPAMEQSVRGAIALGRHQARASMANLDWRTTIRRNLSGWQPSRGVLIPERLHFYAREQRRREWTVIVCIDQSGSMAESVVYGAVMGAVFSAIPALATHVVVFDTEVVDLSDRAGDAVELLFGVQLGGGTDIHRALTQCQTLVRDPSKTLLVLISDLVEGADPKLTVAAASELTEAGVTLLAMLALGEGGVPAYDEEMARALRGVGATCFGCTPARLPAVIAAALSGGDVAAVLAT